MYPKITKRTHSTRSISYDKNYEFLKSKKDRYFIIQGKPNYAQGTAILLGGIIGASELDKRQETGKANWEITSVTKSEFDNSCK